MSHLDDFPKGHDSHILDDDGEFAFEQALHRHRLFMQQIKLIKCPKDRRDYGTDYQLEAWCNGSPTNMRLHVQLKSTEDPANSDNSVSVSTKRTNLNYLLVHPYSIYVCYHKPSRRLLVQSAESVYRQYDIKDSLWTNQETITVRFYKVLSDEELSRLQGLLVASSRQDRNLRLAWTASPPDQLLMPTAAPPRNVHIPFERDRARDLLNSLYKAGDDSSISQAFEQFAAALGADSQDLSPAYMAEVNLAMNHEKFCEKRVKKAIEVFTSEIPRIEFYPGYLLHSVGNAYLGLKNFSLAKDSYISALKNLEGSPHSPVIAPCLKNLGACLERMGRSDDAREMYEEALNYDDGLPEAHYALAVHYQGIGQNLELALHHLDCTVGRSDSALRSASVMGRRAEVLFKMGRFSEAFREINSLVSEPDKEQWVWSCCARLVSELGSTSIEHTHSAIRFWDAYLKAHSDSYLASRSRLMCYWRLRSANKPTKLDFEQFKAAVCRLMESDNSEAAFFWDRIGHWAQDDGNWQEAEECYRKAFVLEPHTYGYCLGVALNFLRRFEEALPILLSQAEIHQPDAMSWLQVGVTKEGLGDVEGSIAAYQTSIRLDEGYDLAWFNLGGVYWNNGQHKAAIEVWRKAISRFPNHVLARKLQTDLPVFFPSPIP